jgi:S-adenosylmethionine:tRNA ribosyltransferase-isomerase
LFAAAFILVFMELSEFDYSLPDELIAQEPLPDRAASRMMVIRRSSGSIEHRSFRDLPQYLAAGDCLVLNDSRVIPCRVFGKKIGYDRQVEIFLLKPTTPDRRAWRALVRPGRHLRPGTRIFIVPGLQADILEAGERGERLVHFNCNGDFERLLESAGHMPLPPYIHRSDTPCDRERYQTVYASNPGSAAAPTAGLHFTGEVLDACRASGAQVARVTLHVGLGTFQPLSDDRVESNRLHSEPFLIDEVNAELLRSAQRRIAVGTTAARVLETAAQRGELQAQAGETDIFIYPGHHFKAVDGMLTNFHLPKSSLLLMICAFAGKDLVLQAYRTAVEQRYRFFSYGDCMLIL